MSKIINNTKNKNVVINKIFPKSISGKQCISQCYNANDEAVHPIALNKVTMNVPFCMIDPEIKNGNKNLADECKPTHNNYIIDELDILYPLIHFDHANFLQKYYKINDINDFYFWLKNNITAPYLTKERIIDCFIISFGKNVDILDYVFSETILDIIKKFRIKKMYKKLCKYVDIKHDKLFFVDPTKNELKNGEYIEERTLYLFDYLITEKNIFQISNDYFTNIQTKNNEQIIGIENYYKYLVNELCKKIIF
jgi:hypothetical protein